MDRQWRHFRKTRLRELAQEIDRYVSNPRKYPYFMDGARELKKRHKDGHWLLYRKLKLARYGIRGVKFITITPSVSGEIFKRFTKIQENASRAKKKSRRIKKVSYVLANVFKHRGEEILLLVYLMGWRGK